MNPQPLSPKAFGLALGIVWGGALVLLAVLAMFSKFYGHSIISLLSTVYLGYRPTVPGALMGGIWGFVDAGIGGYVFAWLYNRLLRT